MTGPCRPGQAPGLRSPTVIPARDEAECVGQTVTSLLRQDYPGALAVIVVDDQSRDATADVARGAATFYRRRRAADRFAGAAAAGRLDRQVLGATQGVEFAVIVAAPPAYLFLTDADIVYAEDAVTNLVARAGAARLGADLADGKTPLQELCRTHVRAGLYFLFPDALSSCLGDRSPRSTAAAAGGCMLVRRDALQQAGGLAAIRDALIDDCALAKTLKRPWPDLDCA